MKGLVAIYGLDNFSAINAEDRVDLFRPNI